MSIQRQHAIRTRSGARHAVTRRHSTTRTNTARLNAPVHDALTGTSATGNENRRTTTANRSTSRAGSITTRKGVFHARANVRRQAHRKLQLSHIARVPAQKPVSETLSKQLAHAIGANRLTRAITAMGRHERKAEQESNSALFHVTVKVSINKNVETVRIATIDEYTVTRETATPKTCRTHRPSSTRKRTNTDTTRQLARPGTRVTFASRFSDTRAALVRVAVKLLAR